MNGFASLDKMGSKKMEASRQMLGIFMTKCELFGVKSKQITKIDQKWKFVSRCEACEYVTERLSTEW